MYIQNLFFFSFLKKLSGFITICIEEEEKEEIKIKKDKEENG